MCCGFFPEAESKKNFSAEEPVSINVKACFERSWLWMPVSEFWESEDAKSPDSCLSWLMAPGSGFPCRGDSPECSVALSFGRCSALTSRSGAPLGLVLSLQASAFCVNSGGRPQSHFCSAAFVAAQPMFPLIIWNMPRRPTCNRLSQSYIMKRERYPYRQYKVEKQVAFHGCDVLFFRRFTAKKKEVFLNLRQNF